MWEQCFRRISEETDLKSNILLLDALKNYDVGLKFWQLFSLQKRFDGVREILIERTTATDTNCFEITVKEEAGKFFDESIKNRQDYKGDDEYCLRKHLVKKGVWNPFAYDVTKMMKINPQDVNEKEADCSLMVAMFEYDDTPDCRSKILREGMLNEYYMKVEHVLPKLGLSTNNIEDERKNFVATVQAIKERAQRNCAKELTQ